MPGVGTETTDSFAIFNSRSQFSSPGWIYSNPEYDKPSLVLQVGSILFYSYPEYDKPSLVLQVVSILFFSYPEYNKLSFYF